MLQGYFDDSGNVRQGQTCLIAGYVAPTDVWESFSKRWGAALREPPSIDYFKMSDAFARSKQFKGWTEVDRDAKVMRLVEVIMETKLSYGVAVSIVNADYLREGKGMIDDAFINDVFYYLSTNIMETCLIHQKNKGITDKIEFIFDSTDKPEAEVENIFHLMMSNAPEKIKALALADKPPLFQDEKEHLPLQAADLVAGQIRSWQERGMETPAMIRLGEGVPLAYAVHDARSIQTVVKGAKMTRQLIASWPPEEVPARFARLKSVLEKLAEADSARKA